MPSLGVIPPAGKGERFGASPKLLADVGGEPLLNKTIRSLLDGGVEHVVVVFATRNAREAARFSGVSLIIDPRVSVVRNPDPSRGMLSSIQSGLDVASGDPIIVLPGDMPFVRSETVAALLAAYFAKDTIVVPRFEGRRGHPIVMSARLHAAIMTADPTAGLDVVLAPHVSSRREIDVDDRGILRDVDVPADLI